MRPEIRLPDQHCKCRPVLGWECAILAVLPAFMSVSLAFAVPCLRFSVSLFCSHVVVGGAETAAATLTFDRYGVVVHPVLLEGCF